VISPTLAIMNIEPPNDVGRRAAFSASNCRHSVRR
jgi:hypothetical protein